MKKDNTFTLINSQNGNLAFKLFFFEDNRNFDHLQHNNFYSLIWLKKGSGLLKVDTSEYLFGGNTVFSFAPYQPFMFSAEREFSGVAIQFHSDFYCIHKIAQETNCDQMVFNNIYQEPFMSVDQLMENKFDLIIEQMKAEFDQNGNAEYKLLVPNLLIFLVTLARNKPQLNQAHPEFVPTDTPFVLRNLKAAIEENYKEKHSPAQYAELLNISPNALAKLAKTHFNKTLTDLITERIIIEAKRELYMTSKTVKEIAWLLGYGDEYYFSRVFKTHTDISPQMYRDTVGFGKADQN